MSEELDLVKEWDKTFDLSEKVNHRKVTFKNHFGIILVADMYEPKEHEGLYSAIAVSGPYGAVHTDLYDNLDVIPFDDIAEFMKENM